MTTSKPEKNRRQALTTDEATEASHPETRQAGHLEADDAGSMMLRPFRAADSADVVALWECCGLVRPWNDPHKDIQRKLGIPPELFLVGVLDDEVIASVMAGYDGHRGWVNYLAVAPQHQHKGYGRQLMQAVEDALESCGCPKLNLQIRSSNKDVQAFYRSLGYVEDAVVSMGKRLIPD